MPDDDLSFGELCYRLGAGNHQLRRTIARLGITPRRVGTTTLYTREQVAAIEAAHPSKSKALRKAPSVQ